MTDPRHSKPDARTATPSDAEAARAADIRRAEEAIERLKHQKGLAPSTPEEARTIAENARAHDEAVSRFRREFQDLPKTSAEAEADNKRKHEIREEWRRSQGPGGRDPFTGKPFERLPGRAS